LSEELKIRKWNILMLKQDVDTIIIGGGLSGIYAAYLLSQKNDPFILLEARERVGGRILSTEHQNFFSDLGPSWYWPSINPKIVKLMQILDLTGYPQFEEGMGRFQNPAGEVQTIRGYDMNPPCWRIKGGMMALVTKLYKGIDEEAIRLNHPVCGIERTSTGAVVDVGELEKEPVARFSTKRIILALPPRLASATILFTPDLSHELTQAMLKTSTWMAGQAKFCAFYKEPYWRETGLSGQAFSQSGPVGEIHDASSKCDGPYGLTGFVSVPAAQRNNQEVLIKEILSQLARIYGESAGNPTAFGYQDWARECFTATQFDQPPMYDHPMYQPPLGKTSIWDGVIHFAGTETAELHGGYLEGALESAERAVRNQ
jgi:monoamine oxidase